ncbi:MAG: type II 3-dehydroquinate dehydratase [Microbacteriaceae bacterium]|jgi:3-dehydroquinate dehydratase-2|nr:type II 3-dehydroquinate dehydratase [Microbacteriaceae bacterium]
MTSILVVNGPNLGRLGSREPEIYGSDTLADIEAMLQEQAGEGWSLECVQSDDEAELIALMHRAVDTQTPVILNPAAFSHYSYALRDACAMVTSAGVPLIEVHLSNPHAREEFRHHSVISAVATGVIAGFGKDSYRLALEQMMTLVGRH